MQVRYRDVSFVPVFKQKCGTRMQRSDLQLVYLYHNSQINEAVSDSKVGSVKLAVFQPSGKKIWTVVGKYNEYWVDPQTNFCSCSNFYFKTLSGGENCYHLKAVKNSSDFQTTELADDQYNTMLQDIAEQCQIQVLRK